MTIEEVRLCIDNGGVIECRDVCQRAEAVQFLVDIGYELHPAAKKWLDENPDNADFLYPGLDDGTLKLPAIAETTTKKQFCSRISKC